MAVIMRSAALITGAGLPDTGITQMWWAPGTVGGSTADATDILARFRAIWESFKTRIHTEITLDYDPICIAIEATTGVLTGAFAGTDPTSTTGTFAGDPLPRQTQGLARLGTSTVINGRRVRGRVYLPGPCEGDNTASGVPSSTYVSAIATAFSTIFDAGATASSPVVWHRPQGGSGGASPTITAVSGAPSWSVLRSRRS